MTTDDDPRAAFGDLFERVVTVADQIDVVEHAYQELMDSVNATDDMDDDEATVELVVACAGSLGVALRVLAMHLQACLAKEEQDE